MTVKQFFKPFSFVLFIITLGNLDAEMKTFVYLLIGISFLFIAVTLHAMFGLLSIAILFYVLAGFAGGYGLLLRGSYYLVRLLVSLYKLHDALYYKTENDIISRLKR